MIHYTGAADPIHDRPRPVDCPPDILFRLQSLHGRALRCEHDAEAANDTAGAAKAHGVAQRIAAFLWGAAA